MTHTPPQEMKPIETAPKDGTRIVIWRKSYGLYSVQWLDGGWFIKSGRPVPADQVTHWMPAP